MDPTRALEPLEEWSRHEIDLSETFRATALPGAVDGLAPGEVWPERSLATAESGCKYAIGDSGRDV